MDRREYRDKRLRSVSHGLCCTGTPSKRADFWAGCKCECHPKARSPQIRDKQAVAIQQGVR